MLTPNGVGFSTYIAKQPEHHKKVSFAYEHNKFIERYGFDIVMRD